MADEQKIVVEVPSERGNYSPVANSQQPSKLELFREGWIDTIAFPNNPTDLMFEVIASMTIPALITSLWLNLPLPGFIRLGGLVALLLSGVYTLYLLRVLPEIKEVLLLKTFLVLCGVAMGL